MAPPVPYTDTYDASQLGLDDDASEFRDFFDLWLDDSSTSTPDSPCDDDFSGPCLRDSPLLGFYHDGFPDSDDDDEPIDPSLPMIGSKRARANMRSCPNLRGLPNLTDLERQRDREEFRREKALRQLLEEQEARRRVERDSMRAREALVRVYAHIPAPLR